MFHNTSIYFSNVKYEIIKCYLLPQTQYTEARDPCTSSAPDQLGIQPSSGFMYHFLEPWLAPTFYPSLHTLVFQPSVSEPFSNDSLWSHSICRLIYLPHVCGKCHDISYVSLTNFLTVGKLHQSFFHDINWHGKQMSHVSLFKVVGFTFLH